MAARAAAMSDRHHASPPTPAEVEQQIDRTRADLAQTLDALEDKLNPHRLAEIGVEMLNGKLLGGDAVDRGIAVIRANPVPVALIGIGAAWLLASSAGLGGRSASDDRAAARRQRVAAMASAKTAWDAAPSSAQPLGHTGNPMVDEPETTASNGWVHQVSDAAQGAMRSVRDSGSAAISRAADYAGDGADVVANQLSGGFERHPLLVGAIGVMAGALVAALLPLTRTEAEWVGNTRDQFWRRAEEVGQQAVSRVRDAASQAASRAADAATTAAVETIREEFGEGAGR